MVCVTLGESRVCELCASCELCAIVCQWFVCTVFSVEVWGDCSLVVCVASVVLLGIVWL